MNPGDKIKCPHCNEETILKKKREMLDWNNSVQILTCAICGKKITDHINDSEISTAQIENKERDNLAALLKTNATQSKPCLKANKNERNFCRDCIHYLVHPFLSRCNKKNKEVNPMDDCNAFEKKVIKTSDNSSTKKNLNDLFKNNDNS